MSHSPEEFDEQLRRGEAGELDFAAEQPELASTLRLLNAALGTPHPLDLKTPRSIDRFHIKSILGIGGFGVVYLAHDPILDREVALKVVRFGVANSDEAHKRLLRERRLAAALHHPNIVPVFESAHTSSGSYIVSEYCPGPTLAEWLRLSTQPTASDELSSAGDDALKSDGVANQSGHPDRIEINTAARIVRSLADAIEHAHQAGILHRDIKPSNILMQPVETPRDKLEFVPRLTDFGLARQVDLQADATRTGTFLGTLYYVSPEQAQGATNALTVESDVYSLGVVLYEILTGQVPFCEGSQVEILRQICESPPVPPRRLNRLIPRDLQAICLRCLEKLPKRRYTAAALRDDLDRFLRGDPTVARPLNVLERIGGWAKRAPATAALIVVSLISAVAIISVLAFNLRQAEQHTRELADALQEASDEREAAQTAEAEARQSRDRARLVSYRSDMRLAFDRWESGDIHASLRLLQQQVDSETDLRGPEWYALKHEIDVKYQLVGRHEGQVTECRLSNDQTTVWSTGTDGWVRAWDVETLKLKNTFRPGIGEIHAFGVSSDDQTIAVAGKPTFLGRAAIYMLDAQTGKVLKKLQSHRTTIESIAFSPDGKWMAGGSRYEDVQLTRLSDEKTFTVPSKLRNRTVAFSHDSQLLCVGGADRHFSVYEVGDPPQKVRRILVHALPLVSMFVPRPSVAAVIGDGSNRIDFIHPRAPTKYGSATPGRHQNVSQKLSAMAITDSGHYMLAGDVGGRVLMWNMIGVEYSDAHEKEDQPLPQYEPSHVFAPHESRVTALDITNGVRVFSGGEDGRVASLMPHQAGLLHLRLFDISFGGDHAAVLDQGDLLFGCVDGSLGKVVLHTQEGGLQVKPGVDEGASEVVARMDCAISSVAVSPNGKVIAAGNVHGGVSLFDRHSGTAIKTLTEGSVGRTEQAISSLAFSPNGDHLASASRSGRLVMYDLPSGTSADRQVPTNQLRSVEFLDPTAIAVGGIDGILRLGIDLAAKPSRLPGKNTRCLAASRDSRLLVSANLNGFQIIDLEGDNHRQIRGSAHYGRSVTISLSGRSILCLDESGDVQFADLETGQVYGRFATRGWTSAFHRMSIHCDDKVAMIATNIGPREIRLYIWPLGDLEQ